MMPCDSSIVMIASAAIASIPANFASDARSSSSLRVGGIDGVTSMRRELRRSATRCRVRRAQNAHLQSEIDVLGAMRDSELLVHALLVRVHGLGADEQLLADLRGRIPLGNQSKHFPLALCQGIEAIVVHLRRVL